jgi:hypothetical protein
VAQIPSPRRSRALLPTSAGHRRCPLPELGGQIRKLGAAPDRAGTPPPEPSQKKKLKRATAAAKASSSESSSGTSSGSDVEVVDPPSEPSRPAAALMRDRGTGDGRNDSDDSSYRIRLLFFDKK